jgi:glucose-1-phosphate cytidylyltransferase
MKQYAHYGVREFAVALGYKGEYVKRYFLDCAELDGSLSVSLRDRQVVRHDNHPEDWVVHLMETGQETLTGGRVKRLEPMLREGPFMLTYGDGVSSVDIGRLLEFHRAHGKLATVTAVRPPARFGGLEFEGDRVVHFTEKPQIGEGWINGGFFVLEPEVLQFIAGDTTTWEREPLEHLAREAQLMAYRHEGFWQPMDTLRDKRLLESLWASGEAPWKVWE